MSFPNWDLYQRYPRLKRPKGLPELQPSGREVPTHPRHTGALTLELPPSCPQGTESGPSRTVTALFCHQLRTRGSEKQLRCSAALGLQWRSSWGLCSYHSRPSASAGFAFAIQPTSDQKYSKKVTLLLAWTMVVRPRMVVSALNTYRLVSCRYSLNNTV